MVKDKRRWIAPIFWGILLAVLSLMPGGQGDFLLFGIPHIDKIGHFGMYAIWTFLIYYAWRGNSYLKPGRMILYVFLIGALIGALLECGQYFMTLGRSFEVADMIANALGAGVGTIVSHFFFLRRTRR